MSRGLIEFHGSAFDIFSEYMFVEVRKIGNSVFLRAVTTLAEACTNTYDVLKVSFKSRNGDIVPVGLVSVPSQLAQKTGLNTTGKYNIVESIMKPKDGKKYFRLVKDTENTTVRSYSRK